MTMNTVIITTSGTIQNAETMTAVTKPLSHLGHRSTLPDKVADVA